jgi:hypothetical protein
MEYLQYRIHVYTPLMLVALHGAVIFGNEFPCHCMLYKFKQSVLENPKFYVRVHYKGNEPLFTFDESSPLVGLARRLFGTDGKTFIFDTRNTEKYIAELIPSREASTIVVKFMQGVEQFRQAIAANFTDYMSTNQTAGQTVDVVDLLVNAVTDFQNEHSGDLEIRLNSGVMNVIERWMQDEYGGHGASKIVDDLISGKHLSSKDGSSRKTKDLQLKLKERLQSILELKMFPGLSYPVDLAEDNVMSRPFRTIYGEIERLAAVMGVTCRPLPSGPSQPSVLSPVGSSWFGYFGGLKQKLSDWSKQTLTTALNNKMKTAGSAARAIIYAGAVAGLVYFITPKGNRSPLGSKK